MRLSPVKIQALKANPLVPVYGVSVDKLLALRGDPALTIQHNHTHSHQHELINALNAANARAEKRIQRRVVETRLSLPESRAEKQRRRR
jgi:hypothetical protein